MSHGPLLQISAAGSRRELPTKTPEMALKWSPATLTTPTRAFPLIGRRLMWAGTEKKQAPRWLPDAGQLGSPRPQERPRGCPRDMESTLTAFPAAEETPPARHPAQRRARSLSFQGPGPPPWPPFEGGIGTTVPPPDGPSPESSPTAHPAPRDPEGGTMPTQRPRACPHLQLQEIDLLLEVLLPGAPAPLTLSMG